MVIGINASAAFKQPRTGVEEYTYQLIKHLAMLKENRRHRFVLYISSQGSQGTVLGGAAKDSPLANFKIQQLKWPLPMWTQIRLAAEMFFNKPDVLFIPVHVLPLIHPENSVVTIHGLEYEYYPEMYPAWHRRYLRWSTQYALKNAQKIIAVSKNTKKDLVKLYGGDPKKIKVVYHGVRQGLSSKDSPANRTVLRGQSLKFKYLLFLGRLELKKNIQGIIDAFEILKRKYKMPHWLILAGWPGFGYQEIKAKIANSKFKKQIIEVGYLNQKEKEEFLKQADVLLFPSFYEGFGLPILEAQQYGCPVVTSNVSSMPEVAGQGAVLIDPKKPPEIAEAVYLLTRIKKARQDLIEAGYKNLKRFNWPKCARQTLKILLGSSRK